MQAGIVLNYHDAKGYGFIKPDGARGSEDNLFFHLSTYRPRSVTPRVGARVMFIEGTDDRSGRIRALRVEELGE
jgi:cold shock CspA family protein